MLVLFAIVIPPRSWVRDRFDEVEEISAGNDPPSGSRRINRDPEAVV